MNHEFVMFVIWCILQVMTCRPRADIFTNLPALRKLDNMLLVSIESCSLMAHYN